MGSQPVTEGHHGATGNALSSQPTRLEDRVRYREKLFSDRGHQAAGTDAGDKGSWQNSQLEIPGTLEGKASLGTKCVNCHRRN